jgi:DNA-binding PadR family transcriptional regulator
MRHPPEAHHHSRHSQHETEQTVPEYGTPEDQRSRLRDERRGRFGGPRGWGRPTGARREFEDDDRHLGPGPDGPRGPRGRGRGRGPFGPGSGPGGSGPGFGPGGFGPGSGPGGSGPGSGPGGFGPGGFGRGGFGGFGGFDPDDEGRGFRGRGRRPRGNVRAAVLALLTEEPRHGYAIMNELTQRSGGLWRPSPGSVYPVLQQLQDEGLVTAEEHEGGRKVFSITEAGRAVVRQSPDEFAEPWSVAGPGPRQRVQNLFEGLGGLGSAVQQVARMGTAEQALRARAVLDEARRSIYLILADADPDPDPDPDADGIITEE